MARSYRSLQVSLTHPFLSARSQSHALMAGACAGLPGRCLGRTSPGLGFLDMTCQHRNLDIVSFCLFFNYKQKKRLMLKGLM